ncbi:NADH-quinone oxidoreductase subunit C [Croceibacterium aestuarii]|uniref:NADH-quinone oxidoreductase subunit C n=1 Tax=Croceibacterium aestuarii TaxID=3064139 RepID=UPI00272E9691|nr:NADH-quinone oxidoreductase subunit C [Croceibacterium sp. D39]
MAAVLHPAPKISSNEGVRDALVKALGKNVLASKEEHGEIVIGVSREGIEDALRTLRDEHAYQQLMDIAGVDYPEREERFEVVYILLSLTKNHRIMVKVRAAEDTPVPTVTRLWPNAGWLEREVFDMYGVLFDGNTDLRRILTDYGFEGHPQRKDFPLTGYQELRYSEEERRVVYEPVELAQDFRSFDFMSPWEGADYVLPGDEKAAEPVPSPNPQKVEEPSGKVDTKAPETRGGPGTSVPKTTESPAQTGAGAKTDKKAAKRRAPAKKSSGSPAGQGDADPAPINTGVDAPDAPDPTEDRPARKPRKASGRDTKPSTETKKGKS